MERPFPLRRSRLIAGLCTAVEYGRNRWTKPIQAVYSREHPQPPIVKTTDAITMTAIDNLLQDPTEASA